MWWAVDNSEEKPISEAESIGLILRWFNFLKRRAYSFIIFGALFCTIAVKFFHACRNSIISYYPKWVLTDIAVLLGVEVVLSAIYFRWPRKNIFRLVTFAAALVCTWSVINACWLIRNGVQFLPMNFLPLFRDPADGFSMVGVNIIRMPLPSILIFVPSAAALTFLFYVLAKPLLPKIDKAKYFRNTAVLLTIILIALIAKLFDTKRGSVPAAAVGMRYNAQLKAITCLWNKSHRLTRDDLKNLHRIIPFNDEVNIASMPDTPARNYNVVIVVLEGIQYKYTSLYNKQDDLTPYISQIAQQGLCFDSMRTSLTHTTKALFGILTGFFPSASMDLSEAVPVTKPYVSLPMILKTKRNYRTAFFQSPKGDFEARPALVHNLGFDKFFARDDLDDPNTYVGYLGSDEFALLKPIAEWIKEDDRPFILTLMCSVTHDPYDLPKWYGKAHGQLIDKYKQTIKYTDLFIKALDDELRKLNLYDNTIFCVIGDHGEAFGEHGSLVHERVAFEEALRVAWVMRAPFLIEPNTVIQEPASSIDFTPTILSLLGFDVEKGPFEGQNMLGKTVNDRKVHFACWMLQGPCGFVQNGKKFVYNPIDEEVNVFDLAEDPNELNPQEFPEEQNKKIADELINWRKNSVFKIRQQQKGQVLLFDKWLCKWNKRVCDAFYKSGVKQQKNYIQVLYISVVPVILTVPFVVLFLLHLFGRRAKLKANH